MIVGCQHVGNRKLRQPQHRGAIPDAFLRSLSFMIGYDYS